MEAKMKKIEINYNPEALSVEIEGVTYERIFPETTSEVELEFTDEELQNLEKRAKDLNYVSIPEMIRASLKEYIKSQTLAGKSTTSPFKKRLKARLLITCQESFSRLYRRIFRP